MASITNKQVYFNFEIIDKFEAGIKLTGPEVKSAKLGRLDLKGSYASVDRSEVWLKNCYIAPYAPAIRQQPAYEPRRSRKLLLNKKEIQSLISKTTAKGVTLVPLRIYNKRGLVKVELGLGKGKKKYDKREAIKKRNFERRKQKLLKNIYKESFITFSRPGKYAK